MDASMSPDEIHRFENEILKSQAVPPDLRALLDAVHAAGESGPLREALGFAFLVPGRDYPLLTGSYLNDADRKNPDIMVNVAAIDDVLALCTMVAESEDGDVIGYWHGPERMPIDSAPIVKLDTEGTFGLMQGRTLSEAMLGNDTFSDPERFADMRAWLAACGIAIAATNWRELSAPQAPTRPDKLHEALYEQRLAASKAGH